ncbi:MAG: RNA-binding protein [Candidatus Aenigmarchaeota archaeon ex4484_56]|nr:MAG: RNA-binding protein [Candidatus Aenigmarchaeota archaeon ex4484_56]
MSKELICNGCNKEVVSDTFVKFFCPSCNEGIIIRCSTCRKNVIEYICPVCKFTGP